MNNFQKEKLKETIHLIIDGNDDFIEDLNCALIGFDNSEEGLPERLDKLFEKTKKYVNLVENHYVDAVDEIEELVFDITLICEDLEKQFINEEKDGI